MVHREIADPVFADTSDNLSCQQRVRVEGNEKLRKLRGRLWTYWIHPVLFPTIYPRGFPGLEWCPRGLPASDQGQSCCFDNLWMPFLSEGPPGDQPTNTQPCMHMNSNVHMTNNLVLMTEVWQSYWFYLRRSLTLNLFRASCSFFSRSFCSFFSASWRFFSSLSSFSFFFSCFCSAASL